MNKEVRKLQGTWNIVSLEMDGQASAAGMLNGARIVVEGDRFVTTGMGATYEGVIKVDASTVPKNFDLIFDAGPEKGNTSLGIYELEGDTWKICLTVMGGVRPKTFATAPGSGYALEILKRGSAVEEIHTETLEPEGPEDPELAGEWSMVSGISDGHPLDRGLVKCGRRVTKGDQVTVFFGPQVYMKIRFTTDRSQTPKAMDYVVMQGANQGTTQRGIFELDSGTLKLCFSAPGRERPTDFTSKPGDGRMLTIWTPVKK